MATRQYAVYGGGFASGSFTNKGRGVVIKDEAIPVLTGFEKHLKSDVVSAATKTASQLMKDIKQGIRVGSADGIAIPHRKRLDMKGLMSVLRRFKTGKIKKGHKIREYMLRISRRFMGGHSNTKNLIQAVNYQRVPDQGAIVGWGSKSSPYWGAAVQEAWRGTPFAMSWQGGNQPYTDKQRRFFAAIGLPIPKKHMFMFQPKAAFFAPFIRGRVASGWVNRHMNEYIAFKIKDREMKALARKTA